MDKVKDALEALKAKWSELSRLVKIAIVLGVISLFAIIGTVYYMNTRVEYSVLFSNLSEADAGTISQDLDSQNIKYKLADDGKTILVDKTKVDQYRIDLAVDNKLPSSSKGFELFDSANMMTTDEDRKIMYQRALTGELENSIAALDDVDKAKVNLTIPKSDNVFDNSTSKKAKASIVLTLKGTSISKDAVQGIVALTTGAVQGLDKKNVKVVDQTGRILNKNEEDDSSDSSSATSKYMKLKSRYEKQMEKKITNLIEPVVGKGKVKASVNVDLNFDAVEKKTTNYSNPQVRSENVQASGKQAEIKQAQTGQVNDNVDNVTGDANNDNASYSRTVNNELNTETTKIINAPGSINRMTSSVVINGDLSAGDARNIRKLIQGALGYDKQRGDTVSVQAVNFARAKAKKKKAAKKPAKKTNWVLIGALIAAGVLTLGTIIFLIIRRRRRLAEEEEEYYDDDYDVDVTGDEGEEEGEEEAEEAADELDPEILAEQERQKKEDETKRKLAVSTEQKAKDYATKHPDVVADLISAWVKEDGNNKNKK
ncbi:flagellar basal-body MS-ring/collar protein FliF [Ligilactobacillus sp.]|uniref:flagellar basal-body MS-ring/collar protein FliF n=1 Tax=Ligilactobacillus sp. TaxID=2767921 RepID=UPI002FDFA74E